jgi:hypothetical protein
MDSHNRPVLVEEVTSGPNVGLLEIAGWAPKHSA